MRVLRPFTIALVAAACGGTTTDDADDTDTDAVDTDDGDPTNDPLTEPPTGDLTCFGPAAAFDDVTWAPEQVVTVEATVTINGTVLDFQEEEARPKREVSFFYDDNVDDSPDDGPILNAEGTGVFTASDTPACQALAWGTNEVAGLGEAKPTFKAHQVYGPGTGGQLDAEFQSVSVDTYNLIPTVLSIPIDETKGTIAGTLYDCSRAPDALPSDDSGRISGARVRVTDLDGNVVPGVKIAYFTENFPDKFQPYTSADGLWGAFNVPPGEFRVEAYALVDGEEKILGATQLRGYADSINIANIFAGYQDGVKFPETCLVAPEVN